MVKYLQCKFKRLKPDIKYVEKIMGSVVEGYYFKVSGMGVFASASVRTRRSERIDAKTVNSWLVVYLKIDIYNSTVCTVPSESIHTLWLFPHLVVLQHEFKGCKALRDLPRKIYSCNQCQRRFYSVASEVFALSLWGVVCRLRRILLKKTISSIMD